MQSIRISTQHHTSLHIDAAIAPFALAYLIRTLISEYSKGTSKLETVNAIVHLLSPLNFLFDAHASV